MGMIKDYLILFYSPKSNLSKKQKQQIKYSSYDSASNKSQHVLTDNEFTIIWIIACNLISFKNTVFCCFFGSMADEMSSAEIIHHHLTQQLSMTTLMIFNTAMIKR